MKQESVKVVVRLRPLNQREANNNASNIIDVDGKQKQVRVTKPDKDRQSKLFCFDDVFDENSTQEEVYASTGHPMIEQVIEGYNATIFAYGQTGSGKTYTMMGELKGAAENQGIIPRTFEHLMNTIQTTEDKNFLVQCSYIEIYNQQIHDLLSGNIKQRLEIRENPDKGIYVKDLGKFIVKSKNEMFKFLNIGNNNRAVAETLMNLESSRSHAIFTLYVQSSEARGEYDNRIVAAKFNLVDLAGSQRQSKTGSTGDRLKQASKINLSLSALGNVISALVDGKGTHVPYRDSKLTRLLQDSLGGNTKTIMIANISSCTSSYDQTLSTLRYASRAKYIQNAPTINQDPKDALLREYENQIKKLRGMLQDLQSSPSAMPQQHMMPSVDKLVSPSTPQQESDHSHLQEEKSELLQKIKQLESKLIHPSVLHQKLMEERNIRQEQLSFMERNYKNLEQEVEQMRKLMKQLRRKYKVASKEIFQLQKQHEQDQAQLNKKCKTLSKENAVYKTVVNTLFTEKQFQNLIGLGEWEDQETFRLPPFYFKDKSTLAFPYDGSALQKDRDSRGNTNYDTGRANAHHQFEQKQNSRAANRKDMSTTKKSTNNPYTIVAKKK